MKVEPAEVRPVALLDRDGTILVDKVYLSDPDGIEFAPGALEGLRLLRDAGFALVLVTNQSGIGRGYFDEAALARVHARLDEMLAGEGLGLAAAYHCPHAPGEGCDCRKPAPGMVHRAMADFGFTPEEAVFIGDSDADMGAAEASGIAGIRVASAGGEDGGRGGDPGLPDFLAAARRAIALVARQGERENACT